MNAVKSDENHKNDNVKIEQTEINQCASCGGNTVYDPVSSALKCPFCGTEQTLETTYHNDIEHDFLQALEEKNHNWHDGERVFHCDNCGAETILDQDRLADFCSFCGSSHITLSDHDAGIKPALVVPFKVSKEEAVEKFKDWMKKDISHRKSYFNLIHLIHFRVHISLIGPSMQTQILLTSYGSGPIIMSRLRGQK